MSGSFSEYAAEAILAHAIGKTAWTMPTTYIALCTVVPTSASTGATLTEATYTGYARLATTGDWGAAVAGTPSTISNSTALTFAACTAGTSTIVGFAIVDQPTFCTLSAALVSGTAYTALTVTPLTTAIASGANVVLVSGANTQTFVASAAAAVGATSIAVTSLAANFAYPVGTIVNPGNVIAWGSCASTVISTTQTPPTFAIGALELTLTAS